MRRTKSWLPGFLLVLPSIVLVGVFVYWLIFKNVFTSLQRSTNFVTDKVVNPGGYKNYTQLLGSGDYQHALLNLLVLTVVFMVGTMVMGLVWAVLLEKGVGAEGFFRSVYLFPMAVSMIAAGVVWRWLLSPAQGEGQAIGLNQLFIKLHLDGLQSSWWSGSSKFSMAAMAIPAIWQLSGYVMALFLAGFRGISDDQREAARIDGASEWKIYRHVLFPQLSPIALSALIILGHMSLKLFDLIYAITGPNQFRTEVPSILMWNTLLRGDQAKAAAIAIVMLAVVAVLVIPYVAYTVRQESNE